MQLQVGKQTLPASQSPKFNIEMEMTMITEGSFVLWRLTVSGTALESQRAYKSYQTVNGGGSYVRTGKVVKIEGDIATVRMPETVAFTHKISNMPRGSAWKHRIKILPERCVRIRLSALTEVPMWTQASYFYSPWCLPMTEEQIQADQALCTEAQVKKLLRVGCDWGEDMLGNASFSRVSSLIGSFENLGPDDV